MPHVCRRRIDHAVGAHFLRPIDLHRHAGHAVRVNENWCMSEVPARKVLDGTGQRRHDAGDYDIFTLLNVQSRMLQQTDDLHTVFIARPANVGV